MVFPGAQNSVRSLIVVGRFGHGGVARARRGIVDQSRSRGYSRQQNLGRGLQSDFEKPRIPRQRLQISDLDLAPLAAMKTVKTICKNVILTQDERKGPCCIKERRSRSLMRNT